MRFTWLPLLWLHGVCSSMAHQENLVGDNRLRRLPTVGNTTTHVHKQMHMGKGMGKGTGKSKDTGKGKGKNGKGSKDGPFGPASEVVVDGVVIQVWEFDDGYPPIMIRANDGGDGNLRGRFLQTGCGKPFYTLTRPYERGSACPPEEDRPDPEDGAFVTCSCSTTDRTILALTLYADSIKRRFLEERDEYEAPIRQVAVLAGDNTVEDPYVDNILFGDETMLPERFWLSVSTSLPYALCKGSTCPSIGDDCPTGSLFEQLETFGDESNPYVETCIHGDVNSVKIFGCNDGKTVSLISIDNQGIRRPTDAPSPTPTVSPTPTPTSTEFPSLEPSSFPSLEPSPSPYPFSP